jgi:hypothetical protein
MPPAENQTLQLILSHVQSQGREINDIKTTLVTLARVEERQSSQRDVLSRYGSNIELLFKRVSEIEKVTGTRGVVFSWVERLTLVAAGGAVMKIINSFPGVTGS